MYLKVVCFSAFVAVAFSAAVNQPQKPVAQIVSQESDVNPEGNFRWSFEADDGTKAEQNGELRQIGEEQGQVMQGSYSWVDDEGKTHTITYIADENGFQPQGEDIPQPPPIPEAILKSLEYNAAHPEEDNQQ